MNITLLMNHDVASNVALNQLVAELSAHRLTVFVSAKHGTTGNVAPALQNLRFVEQGLFNELLFPLLARCESRGDLLSFDRLAEGLGRPIEVMNGINSQEGMARLRASEPDLIISMRFGGFLKEQVIALPRYGILNLHAGLLPTYRGLMATFWTMLDGASEYGCTLHYIVDTGVDTGPVVAQCRLPIDRGRSYFQHVIGLYPHACAMVSDAVAGIERSGAVPSTEQASGGRYFSLPGSAELQRFEASGFRLVDGEDILALARRYTG